MSHGSQWLQNALEVHRPTTLDLGSIDKADLCPGDLWIFESAPDASPERRIVLILDTEGAQVHAALVSNESDFATPDDVVLPGEEVGTTFPVVIETLLHARLWWRNAVERVGALTSDRLDQVLDLLWGEPTPDLDAFRGCALPHAAPVGEFQRAELLALQRLATTADPRFGETVEPLCVVDPRILTDPGIEPETASKIAHLLTARSTIFCAGLVAGETSDVHAAIPSGLSATLGALVTYTTGRLVSGNPHARTLVDRTGARTVLISLGPEALRSACALAFVHHAGSSALDDEPFAFLDGVPVVSTGGC